MSRIRLKNGGKPRRKAMLGADGAIMAAATIAAAGMTTAATMKAAKSQAKSTVESAKVQAQSIKDQTVNSNNLQKEQLNFTRQQNQENRQQQQDIQTTLQIMAGQENMNDRMEANKMQVKYGGKPKRKMRSTPSYGGGQFQVTDGGGAIPISITPDGYGLYELYGNDHEHYHKTSSGKHKTGVGIKFNDGSVVEGEGNQNSNQGELLYVTPNDAMFISKHSIDGFNPTEAVKSGVHPIQAFNIQENLKAMKGLNDDGSKAKCGKRKSIKRLMGGITPTIDQANMTQNPANGTVSVGAGTAYGVNNITTQPVEDNKTIHIARNGKRVHLKCGGRRKANTGLEIYYEPDPVVQRYDFLGNPTDNVSLGLKTGNKSNTNTVVSTGKTSGFWNNYAGAVYNAAGNLIGGAISALGNNYAANKIGNAYKAAGNILSAAYDQMHGIDLSELNREDYEAPHTLAVVRRANTNINPQLERERRNADYERKEIMRGTLSSAARQQRLAATNDRMYQRTGELEANKNNLDEQIKQSNAERITQTAQANADRDVAARRDYTNQRMSLLQYNNNIENSKIAGKAQAQADAITQSATTRGAAFQNSMNTLGTSLMAAGQGFASAYDAVRKYKAEAAYSLLGMPDNQQVDYVISTNNEEGAQSLFNRKAAALTDTSLSKEARAGIIAELNRIKDAFKNIKGVIPNS